MKSAFQLKVGVVVACLIAACGAPDADSPAPASDFSDEPGPGSAQEEAASPSEYPPYSIAEFEVSGITYDFQVIGDGGPDAGILMSVHGSPESEDPLAALMVRYGALTSLEEFLAFAPDAEPHRVLVATHPGQAAAIGRSDDSVLQVEPIAGVTIVNLSP